MLIPILKPLYGTALGKFVAEVEAYSSEEALWATTDAVPNSGGTLAVHIEGNLKSFVGALLGGSDYVRDRDAEFTVRGVPQTELVRRLEETAETVQATLDGLSEEDLTRTYAVPNSDQEPTGGMLLVYLLDHLSYHLGQINYHRRLLDK